MTKQNKPTKNNTTPIWDLIIEDIKKRNEFGKQKYGTYLQAFNGRDSTLDALEEVMDLLVYLKQYTEERKAMVEQLKKCYAYLSGYENYWHDDVENVKKLLESVGEDI